MRLCSEFLLLEHCLAGGLEGRILVLAADPVRPGSGEERTLVALIWFMGVAYAKNGSSGTLRRPSDGHSSH
jgi:hypothetical protein